MNEKPSKLVMEAFANLPNNKLVAVLADLVATHSSLDKCTDEDYEMLETESIGLIGDALKYALDKMWYDKLDKLDLYIKSIKEDREYWWSEESSCETASRKVFYIDLSSLPAGKADVFIASMRELLKKNDED